MGESDNHRGLYGKYRVERVDGKAKGPYFVLAYASDPHARAALATYAASCRDAKPALATDLHAELLKYAPPTDANNAPWPRSATDTERAFVQGLHSRLEGLIDYLAAGYRFPLTEEDTLSVYQFFVDELNTNSASRYLIAEALTAAAVRLTSDRTVR
ncbi:hypothetical protein [Mycolicibacterium llatzerense]|uniref:hypothetical protein n=1 Tax=Mycolicibacterium llatzerense TaxID=280871 RepID=UPI0008DCF609|nr:hypothetical protein [Mycolicibacterium llatzerense]